MRRGILVIGAVAFFSVGATSAFAAAGAAFPNVDVRAVTPPGDVTDRQLQTQGTTDENQAPSGILQYLAPGLYERTPAPAPVAEGGAPGAQDQLQAQEAPTRRMSGSVTRLFFPGLQGNPSGPATVGGMDR